MDFFIATVMSGVAIGHSVFSYQMIYDLIEPEPPQLLDLDAGKNLYFTIMIQRDFFQHIPIGKYRTAVEKPDIADRFYGRPPCSDFRYFLALGMV